MSHQITVRMSAALKRNIETAAERKGISAVDWSREAFANALNEHTSHQQVDAKLAAFESKIDEKFSAFEERLFPELKRVILSLAEPETTK